MAKRTGVQLMPAGTVINYDSGRGYGFIRLDDIRGADVFVHANHLANREFLKTGERVSFEIVTDDRRGKSRADRVRVMERPSVGFLPIPVQRA
jgi:cold shock protein